MPLRHRLVVLALAASLVTSTQARAAGLPPIAVQERVLVMPRLPAGADVPVNLPADGDVKMPFVTCGAPGVASRINEAVWREMLDGAAPPTAPGKTFTPRPDKLPQGTSSLEYTARMMPAANPRLLSLDFSGEGCGAYCEPFAATRLFDLRDGRALALGDLLTVDGFARVGRRVDAERRQAYQKQVRELRAALKSAPKGRKAEDDDDAERLAFDEACLKNVEAQASTPEWMADDDFSLDGHGGLALTIGRCSNHAMRALDDVDDLHVAFPAADLRPALTPYGLAVVQQAGDAPPPPATFAGRELHGRLAGMPVTMTLAPMRDGAETAGSYQYDRFHTPIALSVRQDGNRIHAVERTDGHGEFELKANGGSLVGTWQDKDHRRRLPVMLQ